MYVEVTKWIYLDLENRLKNRGNFCGNEKLFFSSKNYFDEIKMENGGQTVQ